MLRKTLRWILRFLLDVCKRIPLLGSLASMLEQALWANVQVDNRKLIAKSGYVQADENHRALMVLVHEPSFEVSMSSLHPNGFLYEQGVSAHTSQMHHRMLVEELNKCGVEVVRLREVLVRGCSEHRDRRVYLEKLAMTSLQYTTEEDVETLDNRTRYFLSDEYKKEALRTKTHDELVDILLTQPTVQLRRADRNTFMETVGIHYHPLGNLVFQRDPMIVTARGAVIANLNSPQRSPEPELVRCVLDLLNVPVVATVSDPGKLEGGDFIPLNEDVSLIGVGLRTNMEAVQYLMDTDSFGTRRVCAVVDELDHSQDRMHLDTVFSVASETTVVALESVMGPESEKRRIVHEYVKNDAGEYELNREVEFSEFLEGEGYHIVLVSDRQQSEYLINSLNLGDTILACHPELEDLLRAVPGFDKPVRYLNFSGVTSMYGAVHCSTQVLARTTLRE